MFYNDVILYTDIMKLKHLSQKCTKCHVALLFRAAFFSILDEPFYQMRLFSCMKRALIIIKCIAVSIINHSILGCEYLIPSEAS